MSFVNSFPSELVVDILCHLKQRDIFLNFALVCKRWKKALDSDNFLYLYLVRNFGSCAANRFIESGSNVQEAFQHFRQLVGFNRAFRVLEFNLEDESPDFGLNISDFRRIRDVTNIVQEKFAVNSSQLLFQRNGWFFVNLDRVLGDLGFFELMNTLNMTLAVRGSKHITLLVATCLPNQVRPVLSMLPEKPDQIWKSFTPNRRSFLVSSNGNFQIRIVSQYESERLSIVKFSETEALIESSRSGNAGEMSTIIGRGEASINGIIRWSPMVEAAREGHIPCLQRLLNSGASLETPTWEHKGQTPLCSAISGGKLEVVEYLLQQGASMNGVGIQHIPIIEAVKLARVVILQLLVSKGADVKRTDQEGRNAFHYFADQFRDNYFQRSASECHILCEDYEQEAEQVARILLVNGCDINAVSKVETTPLIEACLKTNSTVARILIALGADVNLATDEMSPVMAAIESQFEVSERPTLVKLLLQSGVRTEILELRNDTHKTCLEAALLSSKNAKGYDFELIKSLIEHGAKVDPVGRDRNLLVETLRRKLVKEAWLLLLNGAKLTNAVDQTTGETPLMMAARLMNDGKIVEYMLKNGADVDASDVWGKTALMYAVEASIQQSDVLEAMRPSKQNELTIQSSRNALTVLIRNGATVDDKILQIVGHCRFETSNSVPCKSCNRCLITSMLL